MSITIINKGTINIYTEDNVSKAKDELLNKMYYARLSDNVINGRKGWNALLDMYYDHNYDDMITYINSCHGRCGTRRKEMIALINVIKNA